MPAAALAFALSLAATGAPAQQYPTKPIRIIVPVTAGGPTDTIARIIGQKLTEAWGYAVVIDNRPGAGGTIGDAVAAKAPPDGYTVAFVGMHFIIAPMLHSNAGYDTIRDFAPVTLAAISSVLISAHPSLPARDVRELAQFAKGNRNYVSPGRGTAGHLAGELFGVSPAPGSCKFRTRARPAINDLVGGHVKLGFTALPPAVPHVSRQAARLAVTTLDARLRCRTFRPSPNQVSGVLGRQMSASLPRGTPRPVGQIEP